MATVAVVFCRVGKLSDVPGGVMQVPRTIEVVSEILATGSASVATVSTAALVEKEAFALVTARDSDVWVAAGKNPVAAVPAAGGPGTGFPVLAGETKAIGLQPGERIAAIDWPS